MSANHDRVASYMRSLAEIIAREVKHELDLPEASAVEFGMGCAQKACEAFAGELIYIPSGFALQISARDRKLFAFYCANGRNIVATAKEFHCSVPAAYRRVSLVETAEYNDRQGGLFIEDAT